MKIKIVTSRSGGPFHWGSRLSNILSSLYKQEVEHIHDFKGVASLLVKHFDILHTTLPVNQLFFVNKSILTIHGNYLVEKNFWSKFYNVAIKSAHIITVPSQFLKQKLALEKAVIIPNAIILEDFRIAELKDSQPFKLLTVTNFNFIKKANGIFKLIDILNQLPANINIIFTIIGNGKFFKFVKSETEKKHINKNITIKFAGFQDSRNYYYTNDIFIYYSFFDNMPIVLMEAMASGLPVITNQVGAVNEFIDDRKNGIITNSEEEFFHEFTSLISSKKLRENLGRAAREKIKKEFSWDIIIQKYIKIYENIS